MFLYVSRVNFLHFEIVFIYPPQFSIALNDVNGKATKVGGLNEKGASRAPLDRLVPFAPRLIFHLNFQKKIAQLPK